ncbi:MAG: GMC family oxidoreductase [Bacteroidetes bacterium]|nr:MAG: GMC family oxidoreductase [Bacteroidota bacterium]
MSDTHFDAVIVGSGFGGSVTAYRLAEAGLRVCVLERGRPYPPGSYPRSPYEMSRNVWDPSEGLYGLFNVWSFRGIEAIVGSGLGGGSLIYANVHLRKDERWFVREDRRQGGYEYWPVTRADLDPHYDQVERMLNVQRYPFDHAPYRHTPKTQAMQEAAGRLGLPWLLPPLAVTFANEGRPPVPGEPIEEPLPNLHGRTRYTCRLCGECDIGCNYGSKNTLDVTYLSAARHHGADLRTLCEVRFFEPADGGFAVFYARHDPTRPSHHPARDELTRLTTDRLILAAGTLGTTFLLLKNRAAFPHLSRQLGRQFCGNGDLLAFAHRARQEGRPRVLSPSFGPVITSAIRLPDALDGDGAPGRGAYIEDAGLPAFANWIVETSNTPAVLRRLVGYSLKRLWATITRNPQTDISGTLMDLLGHGHVSASSLPLLGMGRDIADGTFSLHRNRLALDWRLAASKPYFDRLRNTMRDIAHAWGARFVSNPTWHLNRVVTVHPLGGCSMGETAEEGVTDPYGEVFHYPGLFVADGSVMPGPVGPNPALTIAALANRTADRILDQRPTPRRAAPSDAPRPASA